VQQVAGTGDTLEAESVEEQRADTAENRVVGGGQGGIVRSILARQFLGLGDNGCKLLPGQNRLDGSEGVGADVVRFDQCFTQFGVGSG
jgi:hypothetical protein